MVLAPDYFISLCTLRITIAIQRKKRNALAAPAVDRPCRDNPCKAFSRSRAHAVSAVRPSTAVPPDQAWATVPRPGSAAVQE
jgi:hypothetical protein